MSARRRDRCSRSRRSRSTSRSRAAACSSREVARVQAVDGVSFEVRAGETLGLVGESGCGKSTLGRCLVRLHELTSGEIVFEGRDISPARPRASCGRCGARCRWSSRTRTRRSTRASASARSSPTRCAIHGQSAHAERKQRGAGADGRRRPLAPSTTTATRTSSPAASGSASASRARSRCSPQLIVADEPVSALDVSIQAQVVNLLDDLQDEFALTYVFIAHDLGVVRHVSDRIAVMYLGKIVELSPAEELYERPIHPYTEALLSAVPIPDPDWRSASGSCSRATCRARSTRRAAATSTRAAATRRRSARREEPPLVPHVRRAPRGLPPPAQRRRA